MVSRLILGTTISLALVLCPFLVNDTHAKPGKKSSHSAVKASKSSHSVKASRASHYSEGSRARYTSRSYSRRSYSSRSYRHYRGSDDYEPSYESLPSLSPSVPSYSRTAPSYSSTSRYSYDTPKYYRAGVAETGPLMKITPQRDGRFMLEPLGPQKALGPAKPHSTTDRQMAPTRRSGDDYSAVKPDQNSPIYPRWNFPELLLTLAKRYEGGNYRMGANLETSSATDCSGFVQYVCQNFMVDLPRCSSEQAHIGKTVTAQMDFSKMLPGDLLFFSRGGRSVGHVGIYMGNGKMIHASSPRSGIIVTDLQQPYYLNTFVVAKRLFEVNYPTN
jgi:cell wall-associated NlpC family hydrolase